MVYAGSQRGAPLLQKYCERLPSGTVGPVHGVIKIEMTNPIVYNDTKPGFLAKLDAFKAYGKMGFYLIIVVLINSELYVFSALQP